MNKLKYQKHEPSAKIRPQVHVAE